MRSLADFYPGEKERVGFILKDGSIVEVDNIAPEPTKGFDVRAEDIIRYHEEVAATWHTHPGGSNNLSPGDADMFREWSGLTHYIIGENGVASYRVRYGRVLRDEA